MSGQDDTEITPVVRPPRSVRPAPLLMGATFAAIGTVALAMDPDGFGQRALFVGAMAVALLFVGGFLATVAHLVSRRG